MSRADSQGLYQRLVETRRGTTDHVWYRLREDVFAIPVIDKYVVHAPAIGVRALVNGAGFASLLVGDQEFWNALLAGEASAGRPSAEACAKDQRTFAPVRVMLSLTSACQLACMYCYIRGGDRPRRMPWPIAEAAIRLVADNAGQQGLRGFSVDFHGQGEPTAHWNLFSRTVRFVKTQAAGRGLRPSMSVVTNGILNSRKIEFLVAHDFSINLSMDCADPALNSQRPMRSGGSTLTRLKRTLAKLDALQVDYGIQSTVTPALVSQMSSFVHFVARHTTCRRLSFEPLFRVGRAMDQVEQVPPDFLQSFTRSFIEARNAGRDCRIHVSYGACALEGTKTAHCGGYGGNLNFCVSTEGLVSSCYQVLEDSDPRAELFVYGRYDAASESFHFDPSRLERLHSIDATHFERCQECHLQRTCAGDCLANTMMNHKIDSIAGLTQEAKCEANRLISVDELTRSLVKLNKESLA